MKHLQLALLILVISGAGNLLEADDAAPQVTPRDAVLGRRLIDFFDAGYKRGPEVLSEAKRRYETLQAESPNDPRIDFAFGLVQLRQLKHKEAQASFQLATKRPGEPYWPAWQALIWTLGTSKDTTVAYERLTEFTKRLTTGESKPSDEMLVEQAHWIGKAMASFEKMADSPKARDAWLRQDEALRDQFGEKWLADYIAGQEDVHTQHALLEADIRITRDKTLEKREREQVDKQTKTDQDLEATKEKRDELKKTAEEWKKSLDDQLLNFDKQLSRLERDQTLLEKRAQSIVDSQVQIGRQMTQLQFQQQQASNNSATKRNPTINYDAAMEQLQLQKVKYQAEYDQTLVAAQQLTQRAQGIAQQRSGVVQQYQKATGQLVKQDASLDKWQGRLKKDAEKLKAPVDDKAPAVANKIRQVQTFRTYIEWDVLEQRTRLLDSMGVSIPEQTSKR